MPDRKVVLKYNPFSGRPSHALGYRPPSLLKLVGRENVRETIRSLIQDVIVEEENRNGVIIGSLGASKTALREPIADLIEPTNLAMLLEKFLAPETLAKVSDGRLRIVPVWMTQVDPEPRFKIPALIESLRNASNVSEKERKEWYAGWETNLKDSSEITEPNVRFMVAFNKFGGWLWQRGNMLLIFEDEVERDVLSPSGTSEEVQVRQRKLQLMRFYFDSLKFPCGTFLLTTPEAYTIIMELHAALPHRFSPRFVVELQPLSWEDTKSMVELDLSGSQRIQSDNPFAPFTEDALRSVWEWSDGWIRWLNEALHAAIDEYRSAEVIDKKMINLLLGRLKRPDQLRSRLADFTAGTVYTRVKRLVTFAEIDEASSKYHDLTQRRKAVLEGFKILGQEKVYDFNYYRPAMKGGAIIAGFTPPEYATLKNAGTMLIAILEKAEKSQVDAIRENMYSQNADIAIALCMHLGDGAHVITHAKELPDVKGIAFSDLLLTFDLDDEIQRALVLLSSMRGSKKDAAEIINEELRVDKKISMVVGELFENGLIVPALKTPTLQVYNYLISRMSDSEFDRDEAVHGCYRETVDRQSRLRKLMSIEDHPMKGMIDILLKLSTNPLSYESIARAVEELEAYGVVDSSNDKLVVKFPKWEQRMAECFLKGKIDRSTFVKRFFIVPQRARNLYQAIDVLKMKHIVEEENGEYTLRPVSLIKIHFQKYENALKKIEKFSNFTFIQDRIEKALHDSKQEWTANEEEEDEISKRLALSKILFILDTVLADLILDIYNGLKFETMLKELQEAINSLQKVKEIPPTRFTKILRLVRDAEKNLDSGNIDDAERNIYDAQAIFHILKSEVEERYQLVNSAKEAISETKSYAKELEQIAKMKTPLTDFLNAKSKSNKVKNKLDIAESAFNAGNFESAIASVREYAGRIAKEEAVDLLEENITEWEKKLDELKDRLDRAEDSTLASVQSSHEALKNAFEKLAESRALMLSYEEIADCNRVLKTLEEVKTHFDLAEQLARQAIIPRIRRVDSVREGMKQFNASLQTVLEWIEDLMSKGEIEDLKIMWSGEGD